MVKKFFFFRLNYNKHFLWEIQVNQTIHKKEGFLKSIHLKSAIWESGTHGLFSFLNKNNKVIDYVYNRNFYIYIQKENTNLFIYDKYVKNSLTKDMVIFGVTYNLDKKEYQLKILNQSENLSYDNSIWIRITENEKKNHTTEQFNRMRKIEEGFYYRFGKQIIRITKINRKMEEYDDIKCTEENQENSQFNIVRSDSHIDSLNKTDIIQCRICLQKETEDNKFEPNLCQCSLKMPAHLLCLTQWIKKKCQVSKKNESIVFFNLENLKCEVCNSVYPEYVIVDSKKIKLLDFSFYEKRNFILIDVFYKNSNIISGKYLLYPKGIQTENFSIGRNTSSNIYFQDTSVSRFHCFLQYHNENYYFFDENSKFGTLLKFNDELINFKDILYKDIIINNICLNFHLVKNTKKCYCENQLKYLPMDFFTNDYFFYHHDNVREQSLSILEENKIIQNDNNVLKNKIIENQEKSIHDKNGGSSEINCIQNRFLKKENPEKDLNSSVIAKEDLEGSKIQRKELFNKNHNNIETEMNLEDCDQNYILNKNIKNSFDYQEIFENSKKHQLNLKLNKLGLSSGKRLNSGVLSSQFSLNRGSELEFRSNSKNSFPFDF